MKPIFAAAILAATIPVMASAQTAAPAQTPSQAPNTAAPASADTPLETLMANPQTRAIVLKTLPSIEQHPAYDQFKVLSLRQLAPMSGGAITDAKVATVDADLKAAK